MNSELTAGALFAGIGGFCLGFEKHEIRTAWAIENDGAAIATYRRNIPYSRMVEIDGQPADIRQVSVERDKLEPVDVLHAGFPCQSFSAAGERKGFDDERGKLFFEIPRLLEEFGDRRPSVLVLENSPFLRVGEGGSWFIEVINRIKKCGYWFHDANAVELDSYQITKLPQKRKRLFMVAFATNAFGNGRFRFPDRIDTTTKNLGDYIDFEGRKDESYYLEKDNRYHKMISEKVVDKRSIYQLRKYLVRTKDPDVCPTLTANMGLGGHNVPFIFDSVGLRKLTEYECLLLQGFPDSFIFPDDVPRARRYVQVGNSVMPPVASLIAERVKEKILGERSTR
jgi:DNA (cytosine-5)-methyltransferase 1